MVSGASEYIGVSAFSTTGYWDGQVGDGLVYPGGYSDPNYPYVYDSNSSLYNYVESYKIKLEELGLDVQEARLLTYQEAKSLGCDKSEEDCPTGTEENSFITETSFRLGSASGSWALWIVYENGLFDYAGDCDHENTPGVRPVIVVNTSDM